MISNFETLIHHALKMPHLDIHVLFVQLAQSPAKLKQSFKPTAMKLTIATVLGGGTVLAGTLTQLVGKPCQPPLRKPGCTLAFKQDFFGGHSELVAATAAGTTGA